MRKDGGRGLIKRLGISLHAPAHVLDKLLTEHPEVEFVQLVINPVDWDSEFVQAAKCYEVPHRHGLPVIGMEMVKGGGLSTLPEEAEALLRSYRPDDSVSSWPLQFSLDLENTIAILSGMSNMEQMQDNIKTPHGEQAPLEGGEACALARHGYLSQQRTHRARHAQELRGPYVEWRAHHDPRSSWPP